LIDIWSFYESNKAIEAKNSDFEKNKNFHISVKKWKFRHISVEKWFLKNFIYRSIFNIIYRSIYDNFNIDRYMITYFGKYIRFWRKLRQQGICHKINIFFIEPLFGENIAIRLIFWLNWLSKWISIIYRQAFKLISLNSLLYWMAFTQSALWYKYFWKPRIEFF